MNQPQTILLDGLPVSVNAMYRNVRGKGRVKSQRYNVWRNAAGWQVEAQKPKKVSGSIEVSLIMKRPDKRKRDVDNCIKAVLDLLVHMDLIDDDSNGMKVSAEWTLDPEITGTKITFGSYPEAFMNRNLQADAGMIT